MIDTAELTVLTETGPTKIHSRCQGDTPKGTPASGTRARAPLWAGVSSDGVADPLLNRRPRLASARSPFWAVAFICVAGDRPARRSLPQRALNMRLP